MEEEDDDWKFLDDPKDQTHSEEDFYALCNGYIKPEEVLSDEEQIREVEYACQLLQSFFYTLREKEIIQEV